MDYQEKKELFPARAGMNRAATDVPYRLAAVPRTRGDEPSLDVLEALENGCSPHARG